MRPDIGPDPAKPSTGGIIGIIFLLLLLLIYVNCLGWKEAPIIEDKKGDYGFVEVSTEEIKRRLKNK